MAQASRFAAIALASLITAIPGWAAPSSPALMATPPQPKWSDLSIPQRIVLAPLSDDWDAMENYRQKKWISIAARFSEMPPEEQRRIQVQMQSWDKLSPEERNAARENFKSASQLPTEKKQQLKQKWEEYSSLPDAEKEKLKQLAEGQSTAKNIRPLPALTPLTVPVTATPPGTPINTSVSATSPSTTAPTEPAGTETPQKQ